MTRSKDTSRAEQPPEEEGPRSFAVFLRALAEGQAETDLSVALHELAVRCKEDARLSGGKVSGKLTFELSLHADIKGPVILKYSVSVKRPKRRTPDGAMWLTKGGNLTPHNPKQGRLGLHEVAGAEQPPREVEDDDAAAQEV